MLQEPESKQQGMQPKSDILVCIFLRGGMDGVHAVIPFGDSHYHQARSRLAIPEPSAANMQTAIDLDGFFGLHPSLAAFKIPWDTGDLAVVHATGSPDESHSHFDSMDYMESGLTGKKNAASGWFGRHLETSNNAYPSNIRAVSVGPMIQPSLRGKVPCITLSNLNEAHLGRRYAIPNLADLQTGLASLHQTGSEMDEAAELAMQTSLVLKRNLKEILPLPHSPRMEVDYPENPFGRAMHLIAHLLLSELGVEAAAADLGGWDTHIEQGSLTGMMPDLMETLSRSLTAFYLEMGEAMDHITLVTMSEFGRRVSENSGTGTDHGHGNVMFVIGRNINGGRVFGSWPGLAPENLVAPGDLAVTTDYRMVLGEIILKRLKNDHLGEIFPGFTTSGFLGLVNS